MMGVANGAECDPPHTIISLPVDTAVKKCRPSGTFAPVLVGLQKSPAGLYRPPVLRNVPPPLPPQTIISLPVQTAVWPERAEGTFAPVLVGVQESVEGS